MHPLLTVLLAAAVGEYPPADGRAVFLPPLPNGQVAVVSLTGRAYLATDRRLPGLDGFGSALRPEVLRELAGPDGEVGTLDVTLAAPGRGGGGLPARSDLLDHPRVRHALALRDAVRVYGDERGLVTVAAGLAGRTEVSVEAFERGKGRQLVRAALRLVCVGEPVFAAVAPGNARSLRAFLTEGFVPLGSEVIILP
ncbi:hypothetical protein [Actinophytocola sp.]|uniref:hypothetical protein n=1 Tax=Actinophytocola sp. TaxID=1872138 RepID=UPI00389B2B3B